MENRTDMADTGKRKKGLPGLLMLTAAAAVILAVSVFQVKGIRNMAQGYHDLMDSSLAEDTMGYIAYDDGIYSSIGFGIEILAEETGKAERREDFARTSLTEVYRNIRAVDVLYVIAASALAALFICDRFCSSAAKHCTAIAAAAVSTYALLALVRAAASAVFRVPAPLPSGTDIASLAVCILSVIGGGCAEGLMLRRLKHRNIAAVIAVPLVLVLFILSASFGGQLYQPSEIPSFDYVWDIEGEEAVEEFYYDEEKDVMCGRGKEYPPEMMPNPDKLTGMSAAFAAVFEAADPWSGAGLELVRSITGGAGPFVYLLYALKALAWAVCLLKLPGKKDAVTDR